MLFWKDVPQVGRQQKRGTGVKRRLSKSSLEKFKSFGLFIPERRKLREDT